LVWTVDAEGILQSTELKRWIVTEMCCNKNNVIIIVIIKINIIIVIITIIRLLS